MSFRKGMKRYAGRRRSRGYSILGKIQNRKIDMTFPIYVYNDVSIGPHYSYSSTGLQFDLNIYTLLITSTEWTSLRRSYGFYRLNGISISAVKNNIATTVTEAPTMFIGLAPEVDNVLYGQAPQLDDAIKVFPLSNSLASTQRYYKFDKSMFSSNGHPSGGVWTQSKDLLAASNIFYRVGSISQPATTIPTGSAQKIITMNVSYYISCSKPFKTTSS